MLFALIFVIYQNTDQRICLRIDLLFNRLI